MSTPGMRWLAAALVLVNLCYYWYADSVKEPEPVPPAPVIGAQRLVLLSELAGAGGVPEEMGAAATVPPATQDAAEGVPEQCWELGPMDADLMADLAALFERADMPMRSFRREQVDATDYWVYLAVREAEQRAGYQGQLAELGVENYVIGGGELEGNISLGLFTSRERAEAVARPLQERKMPVVIHSRQRRENQSWLSLNSRETAALGWSADLADLTLWPRPAILAVDCEDAVGSAE